MNTQDDMKEKLSAFIDNELNELDERRVVEALAKNPELRGTWERYHLLRSAVREELTFVVAPALTDRVAEKINAPSRHHGLGRQAVRAMGGLAIAASVAAVAIIGLQQLQAPKPEILASIQSPQSLPAASQAVRVSGSRWDTIQPEAENTLNTYLIEHNEFSPASGIGGMMPYVRIVGYDASK